jgi:hypothetical protein
MEKQSLINEFQEQLLEKDKHYVKSIAKMNDDIDNLIDKMKDQFIEMRGDYAQHLESIEGQFIQEREAILARNEKEIMELFELHKQKEDHYLRERAKNEEDYAN